MTQSATTDDMQQTVVFGVPYTHQILPNGDEIYYTDFGLSLQEFLRPEQFLSDQSWFRDHSERLRGTSSIYKVTTKPVAGRQREIVLKWNRMGQNIPGLFDDPDMMHAEFNSPFDYFLPDQWSNTPRMKLSALDQLYRTTTKDDIHIVWRVSRVGEIPDMDPLSPSGERIIQQGYNSPFEEVALALHLGSQGIPTTYPRAIYQASSKAAMHDNICDDRRYETHQRWRTPDHKPILEKNHDYIIFWGFWNGPDEWLAQCDESPFEGLDALLAYRKKLLDKAMYLALMEKTKRMLQEVGIEDLNSLGNHILVSLDKTRQLVRDDQGLPEIRLYNFEFLVNAIPPEETFHFSPSQGVLSQ